jgi:flagellin
MSSLLANTSALTALAALTPAEQNLNHVEDQASTGLAISTSAGKLAYWPIATKMTSNSGVHGAVSGTPGESQPLVSTMSSALTRTIPVIDAIKKELVTASQPGADLNKIETDIAAQQQSLPSTGRSASFKGQKWLDNTGGNSNLAACHDSTNGVSVLTPAQRIRRLLMPRRARQTASLDWLAQAPAP